MLTHSNYYRVLKRKGNQNKMGETLRKGQEKKAVKQCGMLMM